MPLHKQHHLPVGQLTCLPLLSGTSGEPAFCSADVFKLVVVRNGHTLVDSRCSLHPGEACTPVAIINKMTGSN
ncbi:hypothetical protein K8R15_24690 [Escherichia coli]